MNRFIPNFSKVTNKIISLICSCKQAQRLIIIVKDVLSYELTKHQMKKKFQITNQFPIIL